jgi:nitric oxide synthase-interacting protein
LLAQRKEIKRLEKDAARKLEEQEREQVEVDEEAKVRAVEDFEKVQAGLEAKLGSKGGREVVGRVNGKIVVQEVVEEAKGTKRKFELDEDELIRIAREDRAMIRKAIDEEKVRSKLDRILQTANCHIIRPTRNQLSLLSGHPLLHHQQTQMHHLRNP